jgi:hypothetical protein
MLAQGIGLPPRITSHPASVLVGVGSNATFTVTTAPSSTPLRYQWRFGTTSIAGATNASLTLRGVTSPNAGAYSVLVANAAGSTPSAEAVLRVLSVANESPSLESTAVMRAALTPTGTAAFQWQFNGVELPGETNQTLTINRASLEDAGTYAVLATNPNGVALASGQLVVDPAFTELVDSPVAGDSGDGVSWGDYDNDGFIDLYVANRTEAKNYLYHNNADGTFTKLDAAGALTTGAGSFAPVGGTWGDYDNDGLLDLFVANGGRGAALPNHLYHNDGGGSFSRIQTGEILRPAVSASAPWGDYDGDGFLDLFVPNSLGQGVTDGGNDFLFRNERNGSFSRVTQGQIVSDATDSGASAWADYDGDGDLDLLVVHDSTHRNLLHRNEGGGRFTIVQDLAFSGSSSWACGWADFDNDGDPDIVLNGYGTSNALLRNNGDGNFSLVNAGPPVNNLLLSNGFAWGDFDNDGWLDLFTPDDVDRNGLFRNNHDGTFTRLRTGTIANDARGSTAGAWGDFNNDGFLDLVIGHSEGGNTLFRNNGNQNRWLIVRCLGNAAHAAAEGGALDPSTTPTFSNAAGIGAKVRVRAIVNGTDLWQVREIPGGQGSQGQTDQRAHFGLGEASVVDTLRLEWPSGIIEERHAIASRQLLTVTEPRVVVVATLPGGAQSVARRFELAAGAAISLRVTNEFPQPFQHQWQLDGASLPDATNDTLVVQNLSAANRGAYTVVLRDPADTGLLRSGATTLEVAGFPSIVTQPRATRTGPGGTARFTVTAAGATTLTYQWQREGVSVPGAISATLELTSVQTANAGDYTVVVSNALGAITSEPARLDVNGSPFVIVQPVSRLAVAGEQGILTAKVSGSAPLELQWRKGTANVFGESNENLVFDPVELDHAGAYNLRARNLQGEVVTTIASLVVVALEDASVSLGANITLAPQLRGNLAATYQWSFNGSLIPGATSRNLSITNAQPDDAGRYTLHIDSSLRVLDLEAKLEVDPTFTKITRGAVVNDGLNGQGAAWVDHDQDGDFDLFLANSGTFRGDGQATLYRNAGDGTFVRGNPFGNFPSASNGAWGDHNNDGFPDPYIGQFDRIGNALFRNRGDGSFERLTTEQAGTIATRDGNTWGAAWTDLDHDGHLDLFVVNWGETENNFLFRNLGTGAFQQVTDSPLLEQPAYSSHAAWGDFDNDGLIDVVIAHINGTNELRNALFRNNGNGQFGRVTSGPIANDPAYSIDAYWADYDNDSQLDLYIVNVTGTDQAFDPAASNYLYHNNGDGTFTRVLEGHLVNDGANDATATWGDYDNDGYLDLFVAAFGLSDGSLTKNRLYHNNGDGTFTQVASGSLVNDRSDSNGTAWGDYDNDGFLDLFVANQGQDNDFLYRNSGNGNHWLKVKLAGTRSNRMGIGAKVRVQTLPPAGPAAIAGSPPGMWQLRAITGGDGFAECNHIAHFGLGAATSANAVRIEWPSGILQQLHGVSSKQTLQITEPNAGIVAVATGGAQTPLNLITEVNLGSTLTLGVTHSLAAPVVYQWFYNGAPLPLATNATYRIASFQASASGRYGVEVRPAAGLDLVGATVHLRPPPPPAITAQPQDQRVALGAPATFSVSATGTAPLVYQWRFEGAPLPGATNASLEIASVALTQAGDYQVVVSNGGGSVVSSNAVLSLAGTAVIVTEPRDQSVSVGANTSFGVSVSGNTPLFFQWRLNGADLPGATNRTLLLTNLAVSDSGKLYSVVVRNALGSATSREALLEVDATFTRITSGAVAEAAGWAPYWGDYNNDGFVDLLLAQAGGNLLLLNNGDGSFSRITRDNPIVTDRIDNAGGPWADYDNDGWLDVLMSDGSDLTQGRRVLYHNETNGRFTRVTGQQHLHIAQADSDSPVWGDYDNDGLLDVFVPNASSGRDFLYRNQGNGLFALIPANAGALVSDRLSSYAAAWADYDADGDLDLVVAHGAENHVLLHRNDGQGVFTPAVEFGTDDYGGYACDWADYDNDGDLDLIVNNYVAGPSRLFRNEGDGTFVRLISGGIVDDASTANAFAWGDYDNDGWLDLFVANYGAPGRDFLYRNHGDGTFSHVTQGSLVNEGGGSQRAAWADYNNDGFLDLVIGRNSANLALYLSQPNANHWLTFRLVGTLSNRGAVGAKVRVLTPRAAAAAAAAARPAERATATALRAQAFASTATELWQMREVVGGQGSESQSDARPHFGLGSATAAARVRVEWPSGVVQELENVASRQFLTLTEPAAVTVPRLQETPIGGAAQFRLDSTVTGATAYQWRLNGTDIPGATAETLLLQAVGETDYGRYTLAVRLLNGSLVISSPAVLRAPGAPRIDAHPEDLSVNPGETATFSVLANGSQPLAYQWFYFDLPIPGATNAAFALTNAQPADAGEYSVLVTNIVGSVFSDVAELNIFGAPSVAATPRAGYSVSLGATVRFSSGASGTAPLEYQWLFNGLPLPGATNRSLTITNVQLVHEGAYAMRVTNALGAATSEDVPLDVDPAFAVIAEAPFARLASYSVGWADYDRDGHLDLLASQYQVNRLFHNDGNGRFVEVTSGNPIIGAVPGNTAHAAWGDYDNDGWVDLFNPTGNQPTSVGLANIDQLFHNEGAGRFTEIFNSPLVARQRSFTSTWADFDRDGLIDLFVPRDTGASELFRNDGAGAFHALTFPDFPASGGPRGAAWADFDGDGYPDLGVWGVDYFRLFRNAGGKELISLTNRVAATLRGGAWGDFDNDGDLDLYCPAGGGPPLLLRNDSGAFVEAAIPGIVFSTVDSISGVWADYDNDGWLDLFVGNTAGPTELAKENYLYHNNGNGTFTRVTTGSLVRDEGVLEAAAWGDYDNDGFLDLSVARTASSSDPARPSALYRNNGNTNGWLVVQLQGRVSNREGIGAKVRVRARIGGQDVWQLREINRDSSRSAATDVRGYFGLGDATQADTLRVEWPSGLVQELHNIAARQFLAIVEPLPPRLAGTFLPDGAFELMLTGEVGKVYAIERSETLNAWLPLGLVTNTAPTTAFVDRSTAGVNTRYYRAVTR